jgi:hypothetical protein
VPGAHTGQPAARSRRRSCGYELPKSDERTFTFSLPAEAPGDIAGVGLQVRRINPAELVDGIASEVGKAGKTSPVLVKNLDRGMTYDPVWTLVPTEGNTETGTLRLKCVA